VYEEVNPDMGAHRSSVRRLASSSEDLRVSICERSWLVGGVELLRHCEKIQFITCGFHPIVLNFPLTVNYFICIFPCTRAQIKDPEKVTNKMYGCNTDI